MKRVKVLVEGQTEETFVRDVLAPYFHRQHVFLTPILAQTSPGHKGGCQVRENQAPTGEVVQRGCGLHGHHPDGFLQIPQGCARRRRCGVCSVNQLLRQGATLQEKLGQDIGQRNFLPFLMLHEFEAILFCEPDILPDWIEGAAIADLARVAGACASPEEINEGEQTAPSKRIAHAAPKYRKTLHGPLVAEAIGIDAIREKCPHFNQWIAQLAGLARKRKGRYD